MSKIRKSLFLMVLLGSAVISVPQVWSHSESTIPHSPRATSEQVVVGDIIVIMDKGYSRAGELTPFEFKVIDKISGKPIENVVLGIDIVLLEDELTIFSGEFHLKEGDLLMNFDFVDGSDHALKLKVLPPETSKVRFAPIKAEFETGVEPVPPPVEVKAKIIAFVLLTLIFGIAIGLVLGTPPKNNAAM